MFLPRIRAHLSDYSSQPGAFGKTVLRIPASLRIRAVMAKDSTTICPGVGIYSIGHRKRYTDGVSQLNLDKLPELSFSLHFGSNSKQSVSSCPTVNDSDSKRDTVL